MDDKKAPDEARKQQAARDSRGRFRPGVSGNPNGMPKRTPGYKARVDELSVDAFAALAELIRAREPQAVLWLLGRVVPAIKGRSLVVPIDLPQDDPQAQVRTAVAQLAAGVVTIDEAATLLTAIKTATEITSVAEMRRELDELKEKLG